MALTNWLTRKEWNACYFAGLKEAYDRPEVQVTNVGDVLISGIRILKRSGHEFAGIDVDDEGNYTKRSMVIDGGNETVLADMITGEFDRYARAKEMIESAGEFPGIDWQWLRDAVADADKETQKGE